MDKLDLPRRRRRGTAELETSAALMFPNWQTIEANAQSSGPTSSGHWVRSGTVSGEFHMAQVGSTCRECINQATGPSPFPSGHERSAERLSNERYLLVPIVGN